MANFVDRWLERVTTRYPYAVPSALLLLGMLTIGYAGNFAWEWHELGDTVPPGVSEENKASSGDANVGAPAVREGEEADREPARNVRLRRSLLLTGSGVLLVIGSMSVAYSVFWFRLARLKRPEDDDAPPRLN